MNLIVSLHKTFNLPGPVSSSKIISYYIPFQHKKPVLSVMKILSVTLRLNMQKLITNI